MRSCFLERGFDGPFGQRVLRVDARRDDDGRDGHTDDVDRGVALAESFQWAMRGLAAALGLAHQLVRRRCRRRRPVCVRCNHS